MIELLFFGLCFMGFGDCDNQEYVSSFSNPCPYNFTNWHQDYDIKQCIVKDNVLFEKYNRTELPERIVFEDQVFKFGTGREGGSDLEDQIEWFYHKQLGKKLGLDYNKVYYVTVHNQSDLLKVEVSVDDPIWKEYTGYDSLWYNYEQGNEKRYQTLSLANSTIIKITVSDQRYRIIDDNSGASNSKIGEWNENGVYYVKFDGLPRDIYVRVTTEPNPYWQSVKYILNEKFDCGILVTFADGTQQMRNEIPDLGSETITVVENPQFRDNVCSGERHSSATVNKEKEN